MVKVKVDNIQINEHYNLNLMEISIICCMYMECISSRSVLCTFEYNCLHFLQQNWNQTWWGCLFYQNFELLSKFGRKYNIPFLKLSVDLEEESFYNDMLKAGTQEHSDNRENAKFITHGWIFQCTDVCWCCIRMFQSTLEK